MEDQPPSATRTRKLKFAPKAPPQRKPSPTAPVVPKTEVNGNNDDDGAQAQRLMNKFNENLRGRVPKADKKSTVQVAFGPGATSSPSIRKFGIPKRESNGDNAALGVKSSGDDDVKVAISSSSTAAEDLSILYPPDAVPLKIKKDYVEPWNYNRSYYPTTLPLRRPYSGDPELLNEAEFREAANNVEYDENTINPASDLELLEKCDEEKMFLFQMPAKLPHVKRSASAKGKEKVDSSKPSEHKSGLNNFSSLKELLAGHIGKMLVYKSGAVKLKIGDVLYDVNPGQNTIFSQDVVAINTAEKQCCAIREIGKRAMVTINVDSMLDTVMDLDKMHQ